MCWTDRDRKRMVLQHLAAAHAGHVWLLHVWRAMWRFLHRRININLRIESHISIKKKRTQGADRKHLQQERKSMFPLGGPGFVSLGNWIEQSNEPTNDLCLPVWEHHMTCSDLQKYLNLDVHEHTPKVIGSTTATTCLRSHHYYQLLLSRASPSRPMTHSIRQHHI